MKRNRSEFQNVGSLKFAKKVLMAALASGSCIRLNPESLSVLRPRKRNDTPKRKSPMMRLFFMYISMIAMKSAG